MPHIISDREYRELTAYRSSGLTPERVLDMMADEAAPLPLPLWAPEENEQHEELNNEGVNVSEHQIQH